MKIKLHALLLISAACFSASAQSIPSTFFAMTGGSDPNDYPLNNVSNASIGTLGHPPVLAWGWIEICQPTHPSDPTDPCYDWSLFDPWMNDALNHGTQIAIMIGGTPKWAAYSAYQNDTYCPEHTTIGNKTAYMCTVPPADIDDSSGISVTWYQFVRAVINHYGPNNTSTNFKNVVKSYETWNEANTLGFWYLSQCTSSSPCIFYSNQNPSGVSVTDMGVSRLASMARTLYNQAHNCGNGCTPDPNAYVLSPSAVGAVNSVGAPQQVDAWMSSYLNAVNTNYGTSCTSAAGSAICADGVAFHGYLHGAASPHPMPDMQYCNFTQVCYGPITTLVGNLRTAVDAYSSGLPLYNTEGGWGTPDMGNSSSFCGSHSSAQDCDTAWLARYYLIQGGLYSSSNLKFANWYQWGKQDYTGWGWIENTDGSPTPAAEAFPALNQWLIGSTVTASCGAAPAQPGFWACSVTLSNSAPTRIVWYQNDDGNTHNWTAGTQYKCYQDLTGTNTQIQNNLVPVGIKPVILLKSGSLGCN